MYNLLVTAAAGAWDLPAFRLHKSRFLEFTEDSLRQRLGALDENAIAELTRIPTLFAYETEVGAPARVGWISQIDRRGDEIGLKWRFDLSFAPIEPEAIESLNWELDIDSWETRRTHWAVKEVDLVAALTQWPLDEAEATPPYAVSAPPRSSAPKLRERNASVSDLLHQRLEQTNAAPFLFVGSGLPRRYADLETWDALLKRFSSRLPKPYDYYKTRVNGDLPAAAAEIARAFHEVWWADAAFEESRTALKGKLSNAPQSFFLKYEIAKHLQNVKLKSGATQDGTNRDAELDLLRRATIDGIITTNWDSMLESIFPDYKVYVGQEQLLFSEPHYVGEIYKIHGSITDPRSMVLTTEDYDGFNAKNAYLAAKLLTVFIEHPVLFLGYSLSDANIGAILRSIAKCLSPDGLEKLRDRLLFVQRANGAPSGVTTKVLEADGDRVTMSVIHTDDFAEVFEPLAQLKRQFPARLLRQMKHHVYDLVLHKDPTKRLFVVDIEKADDFANIDVVYGVGISRRLGAKGYAPIAAMDLFQDVMAATSQYDAKNVAMDTLKRMQSKYVPCFRYLRDAGALSVDGILIEPDKYDRRVEKLAKREHQDFQSPAQYRKKAASIQKDYGSVARVVENCRPQDAVVYLSLLRPEQIDLNELRDYIRANMAFLSGKMFFRTYFGALIGLYDCLAYKRQR